MFSSTIRFTKTSSPTPNTTPLLYGHSSNQVIVSISGDSIAVFNVHDVKRTATWPLHPKTILSSHPVIHQPTNTIYAPIQTHQDLPSTATNKTIWAWPWDSVVRHRSELQMEHEIYAIFAPDLLTNNLIVVHLNGQVSFVSHDLKSVNSCAPLDNEKQFAASQQWAVQYASDFVVDNAIYLVMVIADQTNLTVQRLVVYQIYSESDIQVIRTTPVPASSTPSTMITFHPASRHLTLLYATEIQSLVIPVFENEHLQVTPVPVSVQMGTLINCTPMSTTYIACLHVLPKPPSCDKSRFAVSLYSTQFGTWQDVTHFDLDLVSDLNVDRITSAMAVVNKYLIVSLASADNSQRSKAVLFRCTAQISQGSLLSVIGRNKGSAKNSSLPSSVSMVLPQSNKVSSWKNSIDQARTNDQGMIRAIMASNSSMELEQCFVQLVQPHLITRPLLSVPVVNALLTQLLSSPRLFSTTVLEWLCEHKYVSGSFTLDSVNSDRNTLLRLVLDQNPPVSLLTTVLQHVRDIPEPDIVYMVYTLCSAFGDFTTHDVFGRSIDESSVVCMLNQCLAYPQTDVYVHAALESYSASQGLVMIQALTQVLKQELVDVVLVVQMVSYIMDAHLTKILVQAATSNQTDSIQHVFEEVNAVVQECVTSLNLTEDTLGLVSCLFKSRQLMKTKKVQDTYIALDGSVRTKCDLTEKDKYVIEVLRF